MQLLLRTRSLRSQRTAPDMSSPKPLQLLQTQLLILEASLCAAKPASAPDQTQGHSDTRLPCVQLLLRIGILRSQRTATDLHPYGFLKEKFLWALVSAVGIFCLGAGVTVAHGVMALSTPIASQNLTMNLAGETLILSERTI